jgi:hypothetical protein
MAWSTPKTDWAAGNTPLHSDFNRAEGNTAVLGNLRSYPTATGTGTAIAVTTGYFELTANRAFTFIASADNSGTATTINVDGTGVKNLYNVGGTDAPNIISGNAYKVWYNGTNFYIDDSKVDKVAGKGLSTNDYDNTEKAAVAGKLDKAGGTMTGVLTAQSNTSYTTKQCRNIILSTADAVLNDMADGDIWIKHEA